MITLFLIIAIIGCKKNTSKAFLTGRLIDNCSGNPVPNTVLYFYQDFKEAPNWLSSDTPESLLETATTNSEGYFYFWGDDYTTNNTNSIYSASIRINDETEIVEGILGEGKGHMEGDVSNKDVGDIYFEGMDVNINLHIPISNNTNQFDSITIVLDQFNSYISIKDTMNGHFNVHIKDQLAKKKSMYNSMDIEFYGKYILYANLYYYQNGNSVNYEYRQFHLSNCEENEDIYIVF